MKSFDFIKNKKHLRRYLVYSTITLIILLLVILSFDMLKSFIITIALVAIASVSKLYKRFLGYSVGFELVTFATIILLFTHNVLVALLLSMLMLAISTLLAGRISQAMVVQAAIYLIIGLLSLFMQSLEISIAAKILVILYNILLHAVTFLLLRYPIHSSILNFVVNVVTNFILIDLFAAWLHSNI